jgi:peptide/nickel transport system ATP-binding protein
VSAEFEETVTVEPTGELVLEARNLRVWYATERGPVRAVDGVSFELHEGEILGLVGESGCGKSTLGRGLIGLLPDGSARDGELRFRGRDMLRLRPKEQHAMRGRDLGMIFQEPLTRLNPLMRISEHFSETLKTHDKAISKSEIERRSLEALRVMGIPPTRYHAYPHEFSGGMRQRLMIALTLVLRPAFVVADEPTTALDVLVEAQIIRILHDLRANYRTALLLITHNLGIIAEACDRVAVMYAGEIVEIGDAREVFTRPKHPYTRELLRSTISLRTTGLNYIDGAPPDLVEPPPGCHFHPRCPDAMKVCAIRHPIDREHPGGSRAACWAADFKDGQGGDVPESERAPLEREEIAVADEA